jgi:hypothetical protein
MHKDDVMLTSALSLLWAAIAALWLEREIVRL